MRTALEINRLSKRFVAGSGSCLASAQAIADIDLSVAAGESVAVVGPAGAGKTTLLLCASGLMTPDIGGVSWFGDSNRAAALRRARLHYHCSSLAEPCVADEPLVHLIDIGDAEVKRAAAWIAARCEAGDGVLVALRDAGLARALSSSMVVLRAGRIAHHAPSRARVAERGFVDRPLRHA